MAKWKINQIYHDLKIDFRVVSFASLKKTFVLLHIKVQTKSICRKVFLKVCFSQNSTQLVRTILKRNFLCLVLA